MTQEGEMKEGDHLVQEDILSFGKEGQEALPNELDQKEESEEEEEDKDSDKEGGGCDTDRKFIKGESGPSCEFCSKSKSAVTRLFTKNKDSDKYICDVCALLMFKILIANKLGEHYDLSDIEEGSGTSKVHDFIPSEIKKKLDEHIIGHGHAKRLISVAVYNHKKRLEHNRSPDKEVEVSKSNVLVIGPTGSGKTLLADTIARILNFAFVSVDVTSLTEAGYVGEDVDSIIQRLHASSGYDVEKTQIGMVCLDEIDKIAKKSDQFFNAKDVSGEGVQQGLLKIIEGSTVYVAPQSAKKTAQVETIPIDTNEILFICCGAFSGLEKIIAERLTTTKIGFGAEIRTLKESKKDLMRRVEVEDLIRYGLIPEFVSRLHIICVLDELDESLLVRILTEPKNSIIKQYKTLFSIDNVDLKFTEGALKKIAQLAQKRKNGARALRSIIESFLYDDMYNAPDHRGGERHVLEINEDFIENKLKSGSFSGLTSASITSDPLNQD